MKELKRRRADTFKVTSKEYLDQNIEEPVVPRPDDEKVDVPPVVPGGNALKPAQKKTTTPVAASSAATDASKRYSVRVELSISQDNHANLEAISKNYPNMTVSDVAKSLMSRLHGQVRVAVDLGEIEKLAPSEEAVSSYVIHTTGAISKSHLAIMAAVIDPLGLLPANAVVSECYARVWNVQLQKLANR